MKAIDGLTPNFVVVTSRERLSVSFQWPLHCFSKLSQDNHNDAPWKNSVTEWFTLYKYIWNKEIKIKNETAQSSPALLAFVRETALYSRHKKPSAQVMC